LASEGDESSQGIGERLKDCKCHLHGKHLYGLFSACNEYYLMCVLSVIIWIYYYYILDGYGFYYSCSYGIYRMEEGTWTHQWM